MERNVMDTKKIFLKIVFFLEIIFSARILFFSIPVFIADLTGASSGLNSSGDRLVVFLTAVAVCYLLTGIVSLIGHYTWKLLHYLSFLIVLGLILALLQQGVSVKTDILLGCVAAFSAAVLAARADFSAGPRKPRRAHEC